MNKRILFLTGTRADFGKLKPLIEAVENSELFEYQIFCTGMHLLAKYGNTSKEISRAGFKNVFTFMNQVEGEDMEVILANTVIGLSRYLNENQFDMIVVHGDRVEALAGATVGALRNILVAHIEGGEISGTIDELIRHSVSKLSHVHFVSTDKAKQRLVQLGERPDSVFIIGSPDIDIMLSADLPTIEESKKRYNLNFESYALAILHPVTTEYEFQRKNAKVFVDALLKSNRNFVVIYPNNDYGCNHIFSEYERLEDQTNIKIYPSLRFEHFLTLLKHSEFIIGNSSAGIHEAPVYGVPTINIGSRQNNRCKHASVSNLEFHETEILKKVNELWGSKKKKSSFYYGTGSSANLFISYIENDVWKIPNQKQFNEISYVQD